MKIFTLAARSPRKVIDNLPVLKPFAIRGGAVLEKQMAGVLKAPRLL